MYCLVYIFMILKTGCTSGAYVTQKNSIDLCDYVVVLLGQAQRNHQLIILE